MIHVLLDEDVPVKLRHHFSGGVHVETVEYRGWKGLTNGELLQAAESEFDALVTLDNKVPAQQNLSRFKIAVVVLRGQTNRFEDLVALVPELERRLSDLRSGEAVRIGP